MLNERLVILVGISISMFNAVQTEDITMDIAENEIAYSYKSCAGTAHMFTKDAIAHMQ